MVDSLKAIVVSFNNSMAEECSQVIRDSINESHRPFYTRGQIDEIVADYEANKLLAKAKNRTLYVAISEGEIVAVGALKQHQIKGIYVSSRHFRRGLGKSMLACLEKLAIEQGSLTLELMASLNAKDFYASQGYTEIEERSDKNGKAILMRKKLLV
jgi:ribosomal protein S18 acetylase RimI-like enzyme